ncbi:ABC transporter ATP-binding protein, partial [Ectothiorhodospiraceae bacterium WFHF3C12]|nr:ABC transporter ATP-binding protein [Ectothiorhodospiraceae bacterium WFHF3C12]
MTEPRQSTHASHGAPALEIRDLHVSYGSASVLSGVDLQLDRGVLTLLGRNGMGKTTLCNTIMGLLPADAGAIRIFGHEATGRDPNEIVALGVGYVPQGRRVWPSLTVDEHLRMLEGRGEAGRWNRERVYEIFPRLAERRGSGGQQLSGGEQQMLAIGRALLANPRLLILDEPTEGLAPTIVRQIERLLHALAADGDMAILLVEQNMKVALDVAERALVMVNGEIALETEAASLKHDRERQRQLLGVSQEGGEGDRPERPAAEPAAASTEATTMGSDSRRPTLPWPTRWGHGNPLAGEGGTESGQAAAGDWRPTRWELASSPGGGDS